MKTELLSKRFADLLNQLAAVEATKHYSSSGLYEGDYVDSELMLNWKLKARNLLAKACGETSEHYRTFVKYEKGGYSTNHDILMRLKAIFQAAREDYEGGFCNSIRSLVQAEVFGNELEQATELLDAGYKTAAAVVAGVVLETTMRELCAVQGIAPGNLNKMNADLMKAGQYNLLVHKRITALADVRNNAAHGHPDQFAEDDVRDMIRHVEGFVADQL